MDKFLIGWMCVVLLAGCQSEPATTLENKSRAGMISHLVFFDLHDSLDLAALENLDLILNSLDGIPEVEHFTLGDFKDLKDARAYSEYERVIQMEFKNQEDYLSYQKHHLHLAAKKKLGPYLAGPPRSYDYLVQ